MGLTLVQAWGQQGGLIALAVKPIDYVRVLQATASQEQGRDHLFSVTRGPASPARWKCAIS